MRYLTPLLEIWKRLCSYSSCPTQSSFKDSFCLAYTFYYAVVRKKTKAFISLLYKSMQQRIYILKLNVCVSEMCFYCSLSWRLHRNLFSPCEAPVRNSMSMVKCLREWNVFLRPLPVLFYSFNLEFSGNYEMLFWEVRKCCTVEFAIG